MLLILLIAKTKFDKKNKNVLATQPSYNLPETLHLRYVFAGVYIYIYMKR